MSLVENSSANIFWSVRQAVGRPEDHIRLLVFMSSVLANRKFLPVAVDVGAARQLQRLPT